MRIYRLIPGPHTDDPKYSDEKFTRVDIDESTLGFNFYDACSGKPLDDWNTDIIATYEYKEAHGVEDYVFNILTWPIVTERLKRLLIEMALPGLRFHPMTLVCTNKQGQDITAYHLNIMTILDGALDRSRSDYFNYSALDEFSEPYIGVITYCLKSGLIDGHDIFKLSDRDGGTFPIFVSERFKTLVEKNGITGCGFIQVEVV